MSEDGSSATLVDLGAGRLEAFSDSVMAVIITILAFELRPPAGATLAALEKALPSLLIYILAVRCRDDPHRVRSSSVRRPLQTGLATLGIERP